MWSMCYTLCIKKVWKLKHFALSLIFAKDKKKRKEKGGKKREYDLRNYLRIDFLHNPLMILFFHIQHCILITES